MENAARCTAVVGGERVCAASVAPGAPVDLCAAHLLAVYEHVVGEVGVTDLLPGVCLVCGSRVGVRYPSGWVCAVCEWRLGDVPDPELAPPRVEVVYYLRFADRIKIGTSVHPRSRLAQIRHDEVLAFERGGRPLEQRRHAQFAELRLAREWFAAGEPLLAHIRDVSAGVDDPWQAYDAWLSRELALRR